MVRRRTLLLAGLAGVAGCTVRPERSGSTVADDLEETPANTATRTPTEGGFPTTDASTPKPRVKVVHDSGFVVRMDWTAYPSATVGLFHIAQYDGKVEPKITIRAGETKLFNVKVTFRGRTGEGVIVSTSEETVTVDAGSEVLVGTLLFEDGGQIEAVGVELS